MRYVLRADASKSIGAGHVMRSSAIAEELIARGEEVVFVGDVSALPWVKARIESLGFAVILQSQSHFYSDPFYDILILDSYEIDVNDSFIAIKNWAKVIAIVDEQSPDYQCDLRIHPGLDSAWVGNSSTKILAGPNYIPFRRSLKQNLKKESSNTGALCIGVVAGGSDPHKLVNEIGKALTSFPEVFTVFLFTNTSEKKIQDPRFHYVEIGLQMDETIRNVDLVFATSSTTSLELIACGFCVGVVCAVDNQKQYYQAIGKMGLAEQIGFRNLENTWELDLGKMRALIVSTELRETFISKSKGVIDFNGASRIVNAIMGI